MSTATADAQEIAQVTVRSGLPADHSFILATWLRSYRHGSHHALRLTDGVFFANHHPIVEAIVARADVLVAGLQDDPGVIIGYLVAEGRNCLHFAYTKKEFRRMRVFSQLLEECHLPSDLKGVDVSHATFNWLEFLAPKFPQSRANPYRWSNHGNS